MVPARRTSNGSAWKTESLLAMHIHTLPSVVHHLAFEGSIFLGLSANDFIVRADSDGNCCEVDDQQDDPPGP
jgi:hypothetical protein